MPTPRYFDGLHEKLPLDEPGTWDVSALSGHESMAVQRGNALLERIFDETRTALPKLVASVRWSILRKPMKEFADDAGLSPSGYGAMEKDLKEQGARAHRSKYTRLLAHWASEGIASGIREQLLDLLTCPDLLELDASCVDLLSAIEHVRARSLAVVSHGHVNGFYHRVGFDVGHAAVEKKFPAFYNTIWQRLKTKTVPDFREMTGVVSAMYAQRDAETAEKRDLRMAQAESVWTEAKKNQYLGRTVEPVMANYLVSAEKHLATVHDVTLTSPALKDVMGHSPLHAERLIQTEYVPPDAVERDAALFFGSAGAKEFLHAWSNEAEAAEKRASFGALCDEAMLAAGFTAAEVAALVGIKPPEERGLETRRSSRYRGDSEIRGILYQNHVSSQVAVEALIRVLAKDGAHADDLREAYAADRARFFRRTGHGLHGRGLEMRVWRELANVSMTELAQAFLPKQKSKDKAAVKRKNLEFQRLERQEGARLPASFDAVLAFLRDTANARAEEALLRLAEFREVSEDLKEFATVREMAKNLIAAMKGANAVSDAMRDNARYSAEWLRAELITDTAEGTFVPPLPPLRMMAKSTVDKALPDEVVRDWYERFPEQLRKGVPEFGKVTQPTARVLCTLIATKEADPMRFFRERVPGVVPTIGTKHLRLLNEGKEVDWKYVHKYLLALSLKPGDIVYRLARELHGNGGNVAAALKQIVPLLRDAGVDVHSSVLPGMLPKELRPFLDENGA